MTTELITDRGRGPELAGTRITVYHLLPHFLDPTATEDEIGRIYDLTREQVAAARAYVLNNPETVLAEHLKIEERLSSGQTSVDEEKARAIHATFLNFKEWLARRDEADARDDHAEDLTAAAGGFPTFREWLKEQRPRTSNGS